MVGLPRSDRVAEASEAHHGDEERQRQQEDPEIGHGTSSVEQEPDQAVTLRSLGANARSTSGDLHDARCDRATVHEPQAGSRSVNVLPSPNWLVTSRFPPWRSAISRAMARPRP